MLVSLYISSVLPLRAVQQNIRYGALKEKKPKREKERLTLDNVEKLIRNKLSSLDATIHDVRLSIADQEEDIRRSHRELGMYEEERKEMELALDIIRKGAG